MDYIRFSINSPVKVTVGVLLTLLAGLIALFTIPIQLVPNVDQPIITIETNWVGRSPEEVERQIIEEQEDKLKGVSNLRKMSATASLGFAHIELEFSVGTNMDRALQEVSDKLREVPEYPDDVDQPVITVADSASENAIAWMMLTSTDPSVDVTGLYDILDKRVKPYLERVDGVDQINIYGGRERQVHIQIDPRRMAERNITFNQLRQALQLENVNTSAGDLAEGRLDVRIRTVGQYDTLDDVRQTIVAYAAGGPIRVGDLGSVKLDYEKRRAFVRSRGQTGLAINAIRQSGSNVITVMHGLRQALAEVNRDVLPQIHPSLKLQQVYDETTYIYDALDLVLSNLWQGGALTVAVLVLFLFTSRPNLATALAFPVLVLALVFAMFAPTPTVRYIAMAVLLGSMLVMLMTSRPTTIVSLTIPLCVVGTFAVMTAFGRNLNVVSLAGLAFAVGMVVDNAIVVLENTDRHMAMGKNPVRAAYDATREVWAAVLASTATTLVVFLPVLTVKEEAGQLFRDISLALCAAVALSLIVALTVIPCGAARWLKPVSSRHSHARDLWGWPYRAFARLIDRLASSISRAIYYLTGSIIARLAIVALFTLGSIVGSMLLMPPTTYLPTGNRNLVFGIMITPPAYNIEQAGRIADRMEANLRPFWEAQSSDEIRQKQAQGLLPPIVHPMTGQTVENVPPVEEFFFVSWLGNIFYGATSREKENARPLEALLPWSASENPGAIPLAFQIGLFGRGLGGTNSIDVEVTGTDLDRLRSGAEALYMQLTQKYGFGGVQPSPINFNLAGPELQVKIDRVRAADLGIDVAALGLGVQALVDGAIIGDYRLGGDTIDILIKSDPQTPLQADGLAQIPLATRLADGSLGPVIPLSSVATLNWTDAPQEIMRIEQIRAVRLTVSPPNDVPLEQATSDIKAMVQQMRDAGQIAPDLAVQPAGTADKLVQIRESLLGQWYGWNYHSLKSLVMSRFFLAMLVNYLIMAAIFESFLYPFVIIFSVPLATIGGFLGLRIMHWVDPTQLLDVVTMLGFVILMGTVVNNAILLVAQALNFMKGFGESQADRVEIMPPRKAIAESVRTRLRPVLMTSLTTVFGLLPLVIMPGAGSELYRGLGSVVLGGMLVATVFTLIVVPLVFSLALDAKIMAYRWLGWPISELESQPGEQPAPANVSI